MKAPKTPRPAFSATPPKVAEAPASPPPPPSPKPQAEPTPEAIAFLEGLPGRVVASKPQTEGKGAAGPKKAARGRKTDLTDMLAGMEAPKLPRMGTDEPLQRLAVDIPASLHAKIKEVARRPGGSIRDDLTTILEWFYSKQ